MRTESIDSAGIAETADNQSPFRIKSSKLSRQLFPDCTEMWVQCIKSSALGIYRKRSAPLTVANHPKFHKKTNALLHSCLLRYACLIDCSIYFALFRNRKYRNACQLKLPSVRTHGVSARRGFSRTKETNFFAFILLLSISVCLRTSTEWLTKWIIFFKTKHTHKQRER